MPQVEQAWTGARGLVYYGNTLLYVDTWSVQIITDTIDITTIAVYDTPVDLYDYDLQNPELPVFEPFDKPNDIRYKQANYGTARENVYGGLRVANITCSGLCATTIKDDALGNYMPRIQNLVYMQFSNSIQANKTLFNFPTCIVKEVNFEFNIKNYQRWNMTAISTGEFDVFPGVPQ
jgi:hypothetical protein